MSRLSDIEARIEALRQDREADFSNEVDVSNFASAIIKLAQPFSSSDT